MIYIIDVLYSLIIDYAFYTLYIGILVIKSVSYVYSYLF